MMPSAKVHWILHSGPWFSDTNLICLSNKLILFSSITIKFILTTNMFLAFSIIFLILLHQSQSATPSCQELLKPLDHVLPQDLEGNWTLVAGGLNSTADLERFKQRDSVLMNFIAINGTSMYFTRVSGFNDSCQYVDFGITLSGSGFRFSHLNLTVVLMVSTCSDCLSMQFQRQDGKPVPLFMYSRRREVNKDEMEEFKVQVACLKMNHVAIMDPTKQLCPVHINKSMTQAPNA